MAFPAKVTKQNIDEFIESITGDIDRIKKRMNGAVLMTNGRVEADYTALGFTAAEAKDRKDFFAALSNLLLNHKGQGVVADGASEKAYDAEARKWESFRF